MAAIFPQMKSEGEDNLEEDRDARASGDAHLMLMMVTSFDPLDQDTWRATSNPVLFSDMNKEIPS